MDSNKKSEKPPAHPRKCSPSSLTPKKRDFGHCVDIEAITLSAAQRKFSRVNRIRVMHQDGTKANLWKVPLFESAKSPPREKNTTVAVATERQLREAAEEKAANLEKKIESKAVFIGLAELYTQNKALKSTVATQQKQIEDLTSKFDALMSKLEDDQKEFKLEIEGLKSTIKNQQKQIDRQQEEIRDLKSTVADQATTIDNLQTTIENQQLEIEDLKSTVAKQQCEI